MAEVILTNLHLLHSYWFSRFQVFGLQSDVLLFRDTLQPDGREVFARRFDGLNDKKLKQAFFQHGFMQGAMTAHGQPVAMKPSDLSDDLFWQFPCLTEWAAWQIHADLEEPAFQDGALHVYVGLPWATWIDKERKQAWGSNGVEVKQKQLQMLGVRISGLHHVLKEIDIQLKVHTVCQHIYWKDMAPTWRKLGVTDVWLSHCPDEDSPTARWGFDIHPWALYAVNVEDAQRRSGLQIGKDPAEKTVLASFVGAHLSHYLSDIRLRMSSLAAEPGFVVRITEKWHFEDVVYQHQMGKSALDESYAGDDSVLSYNQLLSDSVFSLCPSGAGPNSLRLWESLAVGSIPVLLGAAPALPKGGSLPDIDWERIVVRCTEDQLSTLPSLLREMPIDEVRNRQRLGMEAYRLVCRQRCF